MINRGPISSIFTFQAVLQGLLLLLLSGFASLQSSAQSAVPNLNSNSIQPKVTEKDSSANNTKKDSVLSKTDSATDKFARLGIKVSKDAPTSQVESSAKDSAIFEMDNSMFYLYGDALIVQDDLELKAGVVAFNQKENVVSAYPEYDTTQKIASEQTFKQGTETIIYDSLRYNFKSKRALVRNARMQYGEAFINSYQIKRNPDQSIFGYKNLYTTCNLEHPHFGIAAKKIKVIPNKVAASGPANLQIADLPTPLVFPFGIFPINPQQKSGFILPTFSTQNLRGMGLQGIGYYFDINENIGTKLTFDLYSGGSYGISLGSAYIKKYKYTGALDFHYTFSKTGDESDPQNQVSQKDFKLNWSHSVDPRSMPGSTFSANVNVGTGNYNRINGMTADIQTNNTYSSSIAYSKSWIGKPYSFTAGLRHNQNTQTHQVSVTLPDLAFNVSQLMPFQAKNSVGKAKWYEKISASYSVAAQNRFDFSDSNFSINSINAKMLSNGIRQSANLSATYNVLRFINWNFSVPYNEYWNSKQQVETWNPSKLNNDTAIRNGFFASRDFSATTSMSTRIYGMMLFKKGKVAGVRHVLSPSLSVNYTPGFAKKPYEYFATYYDQFGDSSYRSYYNSSPFGGPGNPLPNGALGFGLDNNLQIKVRTNDSAGTKNITLLDGFSIKGNYNFFAEVHKLSDITFTGRTNILNKFNVYFGGSFDPYLYDGKNQTNHYLIEKSSKLATLRKFNFGFDFTLDGSSSKKNKEEQEEIEREREESPDLQRMIGNNGMSGFYDFNIPWSLNIRSSLYYSKTAQVGRADKTTYTPNLQLSGGLRFTPKMMFNFNTGYDFVGKTISTTSFNITRDLHCWQMMFNISPFGIYRNYNFTLNVKSSVLQDLKLTRKRSYFNNY